MSEVKMIATRESYGNALAELGKEKENLVVLDADLAAATKTGIFKKAFPERHIFRTNHRTTVLLQCINELLMRIQTFIRVICYHIRIFQLEFIQISQAHIPNSGRQRL